LEQSVRFDLEFDVIVQFIAKDSPLRALKFFDEVIDKIENIPNNPYAYRKKENAIDKNVRELIYKGYTIPFEIDNKKQKIIILGIFNQNLWE